jgi:hypothetical protein
MGLSDSVILAIADKLLIGVLVLIVGFWLSQRLETLKAGLAFQTALAPQRTAAYSALWAMTEPLSPRERSTLSFSQAETLFEQLRTWYYDKGNAMYLSLDAADLFLRGLSALERADQARAKEIRGLFSNLRTQLKVDLGIYSKADAKLQIPRVS